MKLQVHGGRRLVFAAALGALLAGFGAWRARPAGQPQRPDEVGPAKAVRQAWTTSRLKGSPDPPTPFKVVRAFPNVKFEHPLLMARPPGSDRLFVGEQAGILYSFVNRPDAKPPVFRLLHNPGRQSGALGRRHARVTLHGH